MQSYLIDKFWVDIQIDRFAYVIYDNKMANGVDDELEYHVTFPTPTPGDDVEEFTEGLEGILRKTETAVLLVGWMDSEDKHLAKYSQFWADKGLVK